MIRASVQRLWEALKIAAPRGNALQQLQQSHRTVVDWIHAALRGEARL